MTSVARFKDVCLDANDHQRLARWWCDVLGYEVSPPGAGTARDPARPVPITDPGGHGPLIWINPVPEPKTTKNRMHIDVWGHTDDLLARGARLVRRRGGDIDWDVLADPEGNEFCVFAPREAPAR
jgi:hypothetical protein